MAELRRIAVLGPVYPFKGGISHYTGLLIRSLQKKYEVSAYSWSMQYPKLLFKKEQRDYANKSFEIEGTDYLVNTANPFNWGKAAKKIRAGKPDLCIVQWWHPYFAPCYRGLLKRLRGIPVAFICHNVLPHERFHFDASLTKGTLKRASFCIVHSSGDEEDLKKLLPSMPCRRSLHPTYNIFRMKGMSREEARSVLGIAEDEKVLLFFGLVRGYKGLKVLIAAAGKCAAETEKLKICIVGDFGGKREEYDRLIEESGVKDCFMIRDGYVPDTEVEPYFAVADLCVCPYLSATQSGIVQIAFGFGLPVIATNVGGLPEAVTDGSTGMIVPPGDADALAEAVNRYFREDKQEEFRAAVAREQERFSWDRMVESIEEMYTETVKE